MTSGEGELPEGWAWSRLSDLAATEDRAITDGPFGSNLKSAHYTESGPRVIRLQNIGDGVFRDEEAHISEEHFAGLQRHSVLGGDLVVASLGETLPRACIVPPWVLPAIVKADCIRVRLHPGVSTKYVNFALQRADLRDETATKIKGVGRPRLGMAGIKDLPVPLPPRVEQERIVTAIEEHLSRLDAAEEGVRSSLARLQLFWSQTLAASFSEFNLVRPVGELAEVRGGIQKQPKRKPVKNTAPFLRVANVLRGRLELEEVHRIELFDGELNRYRLEEGDLLVVEGNGSPEQIGRAARWRNEVPGSVHQNHLIRVRPGPDLDPDFLDLYWNAPTTAAVLREVASSTSGLYTLSTRKVKDVPVPVASVDRQRAVADDLRNAQAMVARLETELSAELARGRALRRSILTAAFSGRLVAQNPADESADVLLARIAEERPSAGTKRKATAGSSTK